MEVKSSISAYAGGISGYLFDDFGYIPSLSDSEIVANIKNCISAAKSISIPEGKNVYIGAVCGGVNEKATIENCFSYKDIPSAASGTVTTLGTEFKDAVAELYTKELVADTAFFDTENVWTLVEGKSLRLKNLTSIRDTFYLKESTVEMSKGRISVTLSVSFPDDEDYYVLLTAYDSRGKMVAFKAVYELTESDQIKDITIKESNIGSASLITLVPVNAINFTPITEPIEIHPE